MIARLQYWFALWVVVFVTIIWSLQQAQTPPYPVTWFDYLRLFLVSSWIIPLPLALVGLWGVLKYRKGTRPTLLKQPLVFRVVTRGDNYQAVVQTVANIKHTMHSLSPMPLDWWIEVVTDKPLGMAEQIVVPSDFQTYRGAKWKARALQYGLQASRAPMNAWILHLDEESQIDHGTIYGCAEFMQEQPGTIGQGAILYNRELKTNPRFTLADSLRTGDDIGRFYMQYKAGHCRFGMHGSFILIPNFIEQQVGFDYRPPQCVTEDAYFGLKALQMGYKFGWVNGFIYEQSPRTLKDFLKQRRRWYIGIQQVVKSDLKWATKGILAVSALAWTGSVFIFLGTLVNFLAPIAVPFWIQLASDLSLAIYLALYWAGLHLNLQNAGLHWRERTWLYMRLLVSIPVYSLMEAAGVLYGIIRPRIGFEIISK